MPNMFYCQFQNTLKDLQQCSEVILLNSPLAEDEALAKKKLIKLCLEIASKQYPTLASSEDNPMNYNSIKS